MWLESRKSSSWCGKWGEGEGEGEINGKASFYAGKINVIMHNKYLGWGSELSEVCTQSETLEDLQQVKGKNRAKTSQGKHRAQARGKFEENGAELG